MIGYDMKCKHHFNYYNGSLDQAYDCIKLSEPHEAGEIINEFWLIVNENECSIFSPRYKFGKDYYAKVINLNYFEIIATDINYDDRKDFRKLRVEKQKIRENNEIKIIDVNIYEILR